MNNENNHASQQSMEDMLNASVDELVDLKEFKPLPEGEYIFIFDWEKSTQPLGVRLILRVKEVVELANPSEENLAEAGAPDAKESLLFNFFTKDGEDNSFGQGQLKKIISEELKPTFAPEEGATVIQVLDAAKGAEIRGVLKHRTSTKDGETKTYAALKSFELA